MHKRIAILGSTGSIGTTALRVIDGLNSSLEEGRAFEVIALSGHSNVKLLAEQVKRYRPKYVVVSDPDYIEQFRDHIRGVNVEVLAGEEGLAQIARLDDVDTVLAAIVGVAGLPAVLAAVRKGKRVAIANKEPLVIAGKLITEEAKKYGAQLIPVDSEHSAIFQALMAGRPNEVAKIVLTTSGGPFRGRKSEEIQNATKDEVLAHPVWRMGPKITVDSATMMNKALEIIEARWLFDAAPEKIEVLVHPESIVHSLVEFVDGSVMAQMGLPDMALPIQYALTYPERLAGCAKKLRLEQIKRLTFEIPNHKTFPALEMGFDIARKGGVAAAVFNAANEAAVECFLAGAIKFGNIVELVRHCLNNYPANRWAADPGASASPKAGETSPTGKPGLEELLEADEWAKKEVTECLKNHQPL